MWWMIGSCQSNCGKLPRESRAALLTKMVERASFKGFSLVKGLEQSLIVFTRLNSPRLRPKGLSIIIFACRNPAFTVMIVSSDLTLGWWIVSHFIYPPITVMSSFSGKCTRRFSGFRPFIRPPASQTLQCLSLLLPVSYPSSSLMTFSWPGDKRRGTDGRFRDLNWLRI